VLLKNSQNLYGDCLLRVANRESGGDGSFAGAGTTALAHLAERGGGGGAVVRDGSGLSPRNRLSCADLVLLLAHADRAPWRAIFWDALPLAGIDGTLERRFRGSALAGRLRGKTGHLDGVTGLAGGWESAAGPVRFAALAGGRGARIGPFREWLDALLVALDGAIVRNSPPPGGVGGAQGL
jgi:D-alanyl-D-alanine carboxypeptidase/D-alanyl-D-alanine-endopeptidase (penicillin-binding protein 4)